MIHFLSMAHHANTIAALVHQALRELGKIAAGWLR